MKEFADDNFKFDENEKKLSKQVENTVEKGEIARYSVFKRLVLKTCKNQGLLGKGSRYCNGLSRRNKQSFPHGFEFF